MRPSLMTQANVRALAIELLKVLRLSIEPITGDTQADRVRQERHRRRTWVVQQLIDEVIKINEDFKTMCGLRLLVNVSAAAGAVSSSSVPDTEERYLNRVYQQLVEHAAAFCFFNIADDMAGFDKNSRNRSVLLYMKIQDAHESTPTASSSNSEALETGAAVAPAAAASDEESAGCDTTAGSSTSSAKHQNMPLSNTDAVVTSHSLGFITQFRNDVNAILNPASRNSNIAEWCSLLETPAWCFQDQQPPREKQHVFHGCVLQVCNAYLEHPANFDNDNQLTLRVYVQNLLRYAKSNPREYTYLEFLIALILQRFEVSRFARYFFDYTNRGWNASGTLTAFLDCAYTFDRSKAQNLLSMQNWMTAEQFRTALLDALDVYQDEQVRLNQSEEGRCRAISLKRELQTIRNNYDATVTLFVSASTGAAAGESASSDSSLRRLVLLACSVFEATNFLKELMLKHLGGLKCGAILMENLKTHYQTTPQEVRDLSRQLINITFALQTDQATLRDYKTRVINVVKDYEQTSSGDGQKRARGFRLRLERINDDALCYEFYNLLHLLTLTSSTVLKNKVLVTVDLTERGLIHIIDSNEYSSQHIELNSPLTKAIADSMFDVLQIVPSEQPIESSVSSRNSVVSRPVSPSSPPVPPAAAAEPVSSAAELLDATVACESAGVDSVVGASSDERITGRSSSSRQPRVTAKILLKRLLSAVQYYLDTKEYGKVGSDGVHITIGPGKCRAENLRIALADISDADHDAMRHMIRLMSAIAVNGSKLHRILMVHADVGEHALKEEQRKLGISDESCVILRGRLDNWKPIDGTQFSPVRSRQALNALYVGVKAAVEAIEPFVVATRQFLNGLSIATAGAAAGGGDHPILAEDRQRDFALFICALICYRDVSLENLRETVFSKLLGKSESDASEKERLDALNMVLSLQIQFDITKTECHTISVSLLLHVCPMMQGEVRQSWEQFRNYLHDVARNIVTSADLSTEQKTVAGNFRDAITSDKLLNINTSVEAQKQLILHVCAVVLYVPQSVQAIRSKILHDRALGITTDAVLRSSLLELGKAAGLTFAMCRQEGGRLQSSRNNVSAEEMRMISSNQPSV